MKKMIKTKKIVRESTGRDLVGASSFASRSSVAEKIIKKYPNPKSLAAALAELAAKNKDPKAKAKLLELSTKCSSLNSSNYPAFVNKIVGFSKLWTIVGATTAVAALTATALWAFSAFTRANEALNQRDAQSAADADKFNNSLTHKFRVATDKANNKIFGNQHKFGRAMAKIAGVDSLEVPVEKDMVGSTHNWKDTAKDALGVMKNDVTGAFGRGKQLASDATSSMIKKWNEFRGNNTPVPVSVPESNFKRTIDNMPYGKSVWG